LVDAMLVGENNRVIDGIPIFTDKHMLPKEMLQYKAIIALEGNDVSSGLKWQLISRAVVIMPPPNYSSFAMEEMLEPWVHFVPIRSDLADVEEAVHWVTRHDTTRQRGPSDCTAWCLVDL